MTWVEVATMYEDKQCLQRDVTEVDVLRRGAGRTCLMFVVIPLGKRVHCNGQDGKRVSAHRLHVETTTNLEPKWLKSQTVSIFSSIFLIPEETIDWNSNAHPEGVYLKN